MSTITIFTDGASKGNPGPGGWGAIVTDGTRVREIGGSVPNTTNNRMEMTAALEALRFLDTMGPDGARITVYTDSSYLINGITKWIQGWRRGGWMTKKNEEVLNSDIWMELGDAADGIDATIEWKYVGGHVGVPGNERVDRIASNFADGTEVKLFDGKLADYGIDVSRVEFDAAKKKAKSSSRSRSKGAAYSYVSEVDGEVRVHKTWAECFARVNGRRARFKKAASPDDEAALIREFSK